MCEIGTDGDSESGLLLNSKNPIIHLNEKKPNSKIELFEYEDSYNCEISWRSRNTSALDYCID